MLPAALRTSGTLHVASGLSYPPFEYTTTSGQNQGMDIDLITAITNALGLKLDIAKIPFEGEIAGLASNRFDIAMATFTITSARLKQVNFVQFMTAGSIVSVLKDSTNGIQGVATLCGHKVGVNTGSVEQTQIQALQADCTKAGRPDISVSVFQSQLALVQAVLNGRVDAKFDDSTTSAYISNQTGGKIVDVGTAYEPQPVGFAVAKSNTPLLKAAQAALQHIIDTGTYASILAKWGETKNAVKTAVAATGSGNG